MHPGGFYKMRPYLAPAPPPPRGADEPPPVVADVDVPPPNAVAAADVPPSAGPGADADADASLWHTGATADAETELPMLVKSMVYAVTEGGVLYEDKEVEAVATMTTKEAEFALALQPKEYIWVPPNKRIKTAVDLDNHLRWQDGRIRQLEQQMRSILLSLDRSTSASASCSSNASQTDSQQGD